MQLPFGLLFTDILVTDTMKEIPCVFADFLYNSQVLKIDVTVLLLELSHTVTLDSFLQAIQ